MIRVTIGELVMPVGKHNPRALGAELFTYIDVGAIDSSTKSVTSPQRISGRDAPSRARQLLEQDDVLVSTVRPNLNSVALVPAHLSGATASTGFTVLRAGERLSPRYLFHWVQSRAFVAEMVRLATGASYPAVSDAIVKSSRIPLPPMEEQRRIADKLDQVEVLRASCRELLSALKTLPQTLLQHMFPASQDLPRRPIGELTRCLDSRRIPVKESDRPSGSVPYYGANGQQGWIDQPLFDQTLVLVAEDGGHFEEPSRGVAYRIDGPSWVNNHAHVLQAGPDLNSEYLHRILRHYDFRPYISGSTRSKLTQKQLNAAEIPVPPLDSQEIFASLVALVMRLETHALARLSLVDELADSIQANAFGKI